MHTPWGYSDHSESVIDGIMFYSTPSHGGYHLDSNRVKMMPSFCRNDTFGSNGPSWYEEDVDWAMVFIVFREELQNHIDYCQSELYKSAWATLGYFKPDVANKLRELGYK